MLTTGDMAPDFTLPDETGTTISLADARGKKVVLYFYPKDDTPGCTVEGLEFTALKADFEAAGAVVWGVSKDSVKKHENFCKKHGLGITLLSDQDGTVCEDYGVWQEKKMYGKTFFGIARTTYVIDAEGKISNVWEKVKAEGHAADVLEALNA